MWRAAEDLGRRVVLLEDAALGQHGDAVAELGGLLDVVGDEDDRLLEFLLQLEELVLQALARDRIDRPERLVHQQHRRIAAESPGHADPLALTAGELVGEAPGVVAGSRPTSSSSSLTRRSTRARSHPSRRGTTATLSKTRRCGKRPPCWIT